MTEERENGEQGKLNLQVKEKMFFTSSVAHGYVVTCLVLGNLLYEGPWDLVCKWCASAKNKNRSFY